MLVLVNKEEMLKALKRFKGIAKQDLLVADNIADGEFYKLQAQARRATYDELIALVESEGIEKAYQYASRRYLDLQLLVPGDYSQPSLRGTEKALEFALQVFGMNKHSLRTLKSNRRPVPTKSNPSTEASA